jgi:hypothetical protein
LALERDTNELVEELYDATREGLESDGQGTAPAWQKQAREKLGRVKRDAVGAWVGHRFGALGERYAECPRCRTTSSRCAGT